MSVRYKSFDDRGVYVGFQTRAVELCRCRTPRIELDDYEALIPNWSGRDHSSSNDLVMPFMDVPRWCTLSRRDEMLHMSVEQRRTHTGGHLDPIMMREVRLEIDRQFGDELGRKLAENELEITRIDTQNSFLEILAMFGRNYSDQIGIEEFRRVDHRVLKTLAEESRESLTRLVRVLARTVSREVGMTRELLQERLDVLSAFAAPICSIVTHDESRDVGYLSRQLGLLETFHSELMEYAETAVQEFRDATNVIDINIRTFTEYSKARALHIQNALLSENFYVSDKRYKDLLDIIARERIKISYALDGWASHATRWMALGPDDRDAREKLIGFILREMPSPTVEIEDEVGDLVRGGDSLMSLRGRLVKEMHSWMDDSLDEALYKRVMDARGVDTAEGHDALKKSKKAAKPAESISDIVKSAIAYKGESPI